MTVKMVVPKRGSFEVSGAITACGTIDSLTSPPPRARRR